jgi:hypothetical protein
MSLPLGEGAQSYAAAYLKQRAIVVGRPRSKDHGHIRVGA